MQSFVINFDTFALHLKGADATPVVIHISGDPKKGKKEKVVSDERIEKQVEEIRKANDLYFKEASKEIVTENEEKKRKRLLARRKREMLTLLKLMMED